MKKILGLLLLLGGGAHAAPVAGAKPLFFPADKNNLQVLPQSFEYGLLDADRVRIGDVLIDFTKLRFQIRSGPDGEQQLVFFWPAGLFSKGQLVIKSNSGKAIFSTRIDPAKTILGPAVVSLNNEKFRADMAEYKTSDIDSDLLSEMKALSFMNFCVFRDDLETRISLCSKEFYLVGKDVHLFVKPTASARKNSQIEINGEVVGTQGMASLNDAQEKIVLRASHPSGASLEIETRRKDVDFKDVVKTPDGKELVLTAAGAEPESALASKRKAFDDWQIRLSAQKPTVYLKGEGDIPMRQDFFVKGELPSEKDRIFLAPRTPNQVYGETFTGYGYFTQDQVLSTDEKNAQLTLNNAKGRFRWILSNLPQEQKIRHSIFIKKNNQSLVASYDIYRGLPYEAALAVTNDQASGLAYLRGHFTWWLNNLTYGINLEQHQHLTTTENELKVDLTTGEFLYRLTPGLQWVDETFGLLGAVQIVRTDVGFSTTSGVGAFMQRKAPSFAHSFMKWYEGKFRYFLLSNGQNQTVRQAYQVTLIAKAPIGRNLFFDYGIGQSQYSFSPSAVSEATQFELNAGVSYNF